MGNRSVIGSISAALAGVLLWLRSLEVLTVLTFSSVAIMMPFGTNSGMVARGSHHWRHGKTSVAGPAATLLLRTPAITASRSLCAAPAMRYTAENGMAARGSHLMDGGTYYLTANRTLSRASHTPSPGTVLLISNYSSKTRISSSSTGLGILRLGG